MLWEASSQVGYASSTRLRPLFAWQQRHMVVVSVLCCVMCVAGILPWLIDPLGTTYTAWDIPVDMSWHISFPLWNYGLLSVLCSIGVFAFGYTRLKLQRSTHIRWWAHIAGMALWPCVLSAIPLIFFLWQYLFADASGINVLVQHEIQMLLIRKHLGYNISPQIITLQPFVFTGSTLSDRLSLLVDQAMLYICLPTVCGWGAVFYINRVSKPLPFMWKWRPFLLLALSLFALIILGCAPGAMFCEYQAKEQLALGDYTSALSWLDAASFLNPSLEQTSAFHIERGHAFYNLYPGRFTADTHAYVASIDQSQGNYLGAYQELLTTWRGHAALPASWLNTQMSTTLEWLAEYNQQKRGTQVQRAENDADTLSWLQMLTQIDPTNAYGQYMTARIYYILQNYEDCIGSMQNTIHLSTNADVLSSAYTYIALSTESQGKLADARRLLVVAIKFDPYYHNNTAREELSGLH